MCGIVGLINRIGAPGREDLARAMADKVIHRGPDGGGAMAADNIALGHRRLSIIDLSDGGHQPMHTPDGRFSLSYNGEVYNYKELKAELEAEGVRFRSRSDSEVVLQAIAHWGIEKAVPRFNGLFALICYDHKERKILVARDRYGIKPLYVCTLPKVILLASEIKAFAATRPF